MPKESHNPCSLHPRATVSKIESDIDIIFFLKRARLYEKE